MNNKKLPKGSIQVIEILENKGGLTQIQLIDEFNDKNPRAIRYTIRTLLEMELLIRLPNFNDMRSSIFYINEKMKEIVNNLVKREDPHTHNF
ncbi:hypothetical protein EU534_00265 [Candidatus Heimdallarchaeota archaeon]|nr:MAG: hypothetical protein EU534_00265 [Candidatus Heimdallarchaeota archaeon]